MTLIDIAAWMALAILAWVWYDSLCAREVAVSAARDACIAEGRQFLDDTVSIAKVWLARDENGRLAIRRVYGFEYSHTGDDRRPGNVVMLGRGVVSIFVGLRVMGIEH